MGAWWEVWWEMSYKCTVFLLVAKIHKYLLQQVVTELNAHMEKLESLLRSRSLLVPLAHHGALVYSLLHQLVEVELIALFPGRLPLCFLDRMHFLGRVHEACVQENRVGDGLGTRPMSLYTTLQNLAV